ncbi:DNA phosphorothioation-associated DGQHR protein 1 [Arcicella aurantiaca]|uniref:DNA phosphorothioation-associated DGQHR protein 1 n=1 Tax=Arcicella aurantiaca TaxID=591202 RepID=A0A316DG56_9BACT|nr:DGQHR domain-containing protein [Arcicella aurantiaca]PWK17191.1 DNA phosphorothioation-associated DGQHR protein 1 [Arcicella aurantiaca]
MKRQLDALEVKQPFGVFYLCVMKAKDLLELTFTSPIRYENGKLVGSQRLLDEDRRVKEIKEFVEGYDAAIPNSIILAANYDENGFNVDDDSIRWKYEKGKLIIPTESRITSIIDGQHRLFGFKDANYAAQEMDLVCSVYIDLPNALQAFLFATINSNQRKVDKSLAYEQFGFNVDNEKSESWSPDKLAIALYKKFNEDSDSPFFHHIKIAPQIDEVLRQTLQDSEWRISTATIVDGILRLISSNPKRDKYELQKIYISERSRDALKYDNTPLRMLYLNNQDSVIYRIIFNFFESAKECLFSHATPSSYIFKTVGVQGLFDFLRDLLNMDYKEDNTLKSANLSKTRFVEVLQKASSVNFSDNYFQASGVGRSRVKNLLLFANNMYTGNKQEEISEMNRLLGR